MVWVNAPVPCPDPAFTRGHHGVRHATRRSETARGLALHSIKGSACGVGLAMGPATVRGIGSRAPSIHAIGNVVNLASRLCPSAENSEVLVIALQRMQSVACAFG